MLNNTFLPQFIAYFYFISVPSEPPAEMNATEITSTQITIQWKRVPFPASNGFLKYFTLYINGILANETHQSLFVNTTYSDSLEIYTATLHSVPATMFTFELAGCTKIGCGINKTLVLSTLEESKFQIKNKF